MHPLQKMICDRHHHPGLGIWSCCSANKWVLRAAMRRSKDRYLLIESTANQVNQFGGYTDMTPEQFVSFVQGIAREECFPLSSIILGGDHLGPLVWSDLPEEEAMLRAETLVRDYVLAGFTKIHLDTSMMLAGDRSPLADDVIARRGAQLCAVCELAYVRRRETYPNTEAPVYVIGSEVPIPGGVQKQEDSISITRPGAARATIKSFHSHFFHRGLTDAWNRVIALVVQPGVEFGDDTVFDYDHAAAKQLSAVMDNMGMVFEAHSTDYQTVSGLSEMVRDGFAILKVGPALTFALREALFALAHIEEVLAPVYSFTSSCLRDVLDQEMYRDDSHWKRHYHGTDAEKALKRAYSYSDRSRYYLPVAAVSEAVLSLMENLSGCDIPLPLIRQYLPSQYYRIINKVLDNDPYVLLYDHIGDCIDEYLLATGVI